MCLAEVVLLLIHTHRTIYHSEKGENMKKLKVLELFAGTRSISKAFEERGHETFSVEWSKDFENINMYADILTVTADDILREFGRPDVIWASPDCSTFSIAAISHHRRKNPITGCKYGDTRMKPTDIWTNHPDPKFLPMCKNGDPCHEPAPRGSKTGTQGLKGSKERSIIPQKLCEHIVDICERGENDGSIKHD